jgi:hypothetical protein
VPDHLDDRVAPWHMPSITDELQRSVNTACEAVDAVLAPWGGSQLCLDAYETVVRAASDLHMTVARTAHLEPVRSFAAAWANMTRDIGAVQLSTARWFLAG